MSDDDFNINLNNDDDDNVFNESINILYYDSNTVQWTYDSLYNLNTRELVHQLCHLSENDLDIFLTNNKKYSGSEVYYPIFRAFMSSPGYIKFSQEFMLKKIRDIKELIENYGYKFERFYTAKDYPAVIIALKFNK